MERAARWYEERNASKGVEFLAAVESTISALRENPLRFLRVGRVRRALVRGFPYTIVFQVSDERIIVTNCVHQHRDPRRWMRG
jgi:plasmid stabilization system protein ParE